MGAEPWGRITLLRSEGWWDGREPMSRDQGCDPSWATAGASWCTLQSRREEGRTRTHSHSTWAALLLPWARIWPTPNTCRAKRDSHTPRKKKKKVKKLQWAACKTCCVFWWEICRGYARHLLLFESRQRNGIGGRVGKVVVADQGSGSSFLSALEHLSYLWQ